MKRAALAVVDRRGGLASCRPPRAASLREPAVPVSGYLRDGQTAFTGQDDLPSIADTNRSIRSSSADGVGRYATGASELAISPSMVAYPA